MDGAALGRRVRVVVDRPMGSRHPEHEDIVYPINYGYVPGVPGGDGEAQDAYLLGVDEPVARFEGVVAAVIHRLDDMEDKWVVAPEGMAVSAEQVRAATDFQERFFTTRIRVRPGRDAKGSG
ncbi:MAG: inorganic pyrophosphatase [Christensenellales bacterium]